MLRRVNVYVFKNTTQLVYLKFYEIYLKDSFYIILSECSKRCYMDILNFINLTLNFMNIQDINNVINLTY